MKFIRIISWSFIFVFSFLAATAQQQSPGLSFNTTQDLQQFLSYSKKRVPLISAHRGGPEKGYPENALETFQHSILFQPLIIECDISLSKDSVLLLLHDNRLDRTTTGSGRIGDFIYDELKKLRLKDNNGDSTPFRIPLLDDVLKWGKGKVIFTLDVKRGVPYSKVIEAVRRCKAEACSVIITYNADQAAEVHQLAPDLMISASIQNKEDLARLNDRGVPDNRLVAFVGVSEGSAELYELLHTRGILCILGTMGNLDKQAIARGEKNYYGLIERGADILSTDRPREAGEILKQYRQDNQLNIPVSRNTATEAQDTSQLKVPGRRNSTAQQKKPYVILISADGFRYDYAEKYQASHLLSMARQGVRAESMIPSFPSVTFPNHYTIVTGLYPSHHGLVNNSFYDPAKKTGYSMSNREKVRNGEWYGGTPLWVLAEQQQLLSASMFWVGSEAPVKNVRPTYYYNFNDRMPISDRVQAVKDWLMLPEAERPHFITFYLSETDHAGHRYGPEASETATAVKEVDSAIYQLTEAVRQTGLPVNFIFVADHGMTAVDREHPIRMPRAIDTSRFIIPSSGTTLVLHARNKADIQPVYEALKKEENHFKVYLKSNVPANLHYGAGDDRMNRIGDILLIPDWPYVFSERKPGVGYHGFPPLQVKEMGAVFIAWGPAFKSDYIIPSFENVHVFPLITEILGLKYTEPVDGKKSVLKRILK